MSACIPYSKCVVKECNRNATEERKSFFRFPKEHDRYDMFILIIVRNIYKNVYYKIFYTHFHTNIYVSYIFIHMCVLYFFILRNCYNRWLKWIKACGRFDLEKMGVEYVHKTYRLCHLHFEKKWYKVHTTRTYLHPDAIPTIFSGKKLVLINIL